MLSADKANRKVNFSIQAKEIAEEKEAVQQYGSSDSGASLGEILSVALNKERIKIKTLHFDNVFRLADFRRK